MTDTEFEKYFSEVCSQFEQHFADENYAAAKAVLHKAVEELPEEHYLWGNLGMAYYEGKEYAEAIKYTSKAMELEPNDPLIIDYHAAVLRMSNQPKEAIQLWQDLLDRGVEEIAYCDFGEGLRWSQSFLNDILWKIAMSFKDMKEYSKSKEYLERHLANRKRGQYSLYPKRKIERWLKEVEQKISDK